MPFFIVTSARWRLGQKQKTEMEQTRNKQSYNTPKYKILSAKVEASLQMSDHSTHITMTHNFIKSITVIFLLLTSAFTTGCSKIDNWFRDDDSSVELVHITCNVDMDGSDRDGLSVMTIGSGYSLSSDSTLLKVQKSDMPQLVIVVDKDDHVRMLYRDIIHMEKNIEINVHSTALAMVTCNPTISMIGDSNYAIMLAIIENLPSFASFENLVQQQISAGNDLFDTSNIQMFQKLQSVYDDLFDSTNDNKTDAKDATLPMPWADYTPLKCEWLTPSNPGLTGCFYLSNFALVPSYYGTITSTSGVTKELIIPTIDRYTLGSLASGIIPGVDAAHGERVLVALSREANNTIELTNLNDYRAVLDFGAHFLGDIITSMSLPVDIADKDLVTLAQGIGSMVMDAITDNSPCNYRTLANSALHYSLEFIAREVERNFLRNSEKTWAKKMCDITIKRILSWYNTVIGVTNLVARIAYWATYPNDISFCAWYGRENSNMQVTECKEIYTVSYAVNGGSRNQNGGVDFDMDIRLCGDIGGLRTSDINEFGYYIKFSNSYEYHKVPNLNPTEYDSPYTYTLTVEDDEFQYINGEKVARGFYIGFYATKNNNNKIDYYDEKEIEGLVYPSEEKECLTRFFQTTGGRNWRSKTNWCSDAPLSDWFGVSVDDAGNVIEVNLSNNNLVNSNSIIDLSCLAHLQEINLNNNSFNNLTITGPYNNTTKLYLENSTHGEITINGFTQASIGGGADMSSISCNCRKIYVSNCNFGNTVLPFSNAFADSVIITNCQMYNCGASSSYLQFTNSSTSNTWYCTTSQKLIINNSYCSTICRGDFYDNTLIVLQNATLWRSNWDDESLITITRTITGSQWDSLFN